MDELFWLGLLACVLLATGGACLVGWTIGHRDPAPWQVCADDCRRPAAAGWSYEEIRAEDGERRELVRCVCGEGE